MENMLGISPGMLAKKGYKSVFDIITQTRQQFISANMPWLGRRGAKVYDLALGQAHYIRRLFRKTQLTSQVQASLQATPGSKHFKGTSGVSDTPGLMQNGPTWINQFSENWQAYCQSGAPEADDSPVSYLAWLYKQALSYEEAMALAGGDIIPLSERRPDLAEMVIDDTAINQVIPTLQLVNEILEETLSGVIPADSTVDETLAVTRYPTLLPYHFPQDQVALALQNVSLPLEDIIGQTATDWPWFLSDSLTGSRSLSASELGSNFAAEQMTIVTEPDNSTSDDLNAFYKTNLGLDTGTWMPFAASDTLAEQLGITIPQLEQLIAATAGGTTVVASENTAATSVTSADYGAKFINAGASPAIALTPGNAADYLQEYSNRNSDNALVVSNTEQSVGKFSSGVQTLSDSTSYACFSPDSDSAAMLKGDKSFSMAFWFYWCNDTAYQTPIFSNGGDANDPSYSPGFSLSTYQYPNNTGYAENDLIFYITEKGGGSKGTSWKSYFDLNQWVFISLTWDATEKKANIYFVPEGGSVVVPSISIYASELGDITTADGFTWAFNSRGDLSCYNQQTSNASNFIYDDIAVFDRVLSLDDVNSIVAANAPLSQLTSVGYRYYYPLDFGYLDNLSDARMDRINRMARLQRWLGLSYEEVDLLLCACIAAQGSQNSDTSLNAHTLRMLGVFRHWQQKYGVTAMQFAAVLSTIATYAISPAVPYFDQIFNSPSLFEEPFAITGATVTYTNTSGDSARVVRQLCAGLGLSEAQFRVLADKVAARQGDASAHTFPLTLEVISALYRLAMVPHWLGLTFVEGAALLSLLNGAWESLAEVPQLAFDDDNQPVSGDILDLLMALDSAADWAKDHAISWVKSYLTLQPTPATILASSATVNLINGIKQQLPATLLGEQNFSSLPVPVDGDGWSWMTTLSDLIDPAGLILPAATDYNTLSSMVQADIASVQFDAAVDVSALAGTLATTLWQAKLAQNGIADSALAQQFSTTQSLSTFLLQWEEDTEYRLLADSLMMNDQQSLSDASAIPYDYLSHLYQLGLRASIAAQFQLSPAMLSVFLTHYTWFGVKDGALTLTLLQRFSRYLDWLTLAEKEDAVLGYLQLVNGDTPPEASVAADLLAVQLGWEGSEVELAAAGFAMGVASSVDHVDYVMRLQTLCALTGLSVTPLLATGALTVGTTTATWDAWQSVGESLVAAQA
ncbi:hypothetical protein ITX56_14455 [Leclercia sp. EMC7]|uniref:Virulence plasmid A protein n=2 Tax=Leclercia barmai TaxID=2785629 RepID=A0ABS7RY49_9ENTR|nr:hypothetical protein [Leclercia sp. EMC7]